MEDTISLLKECDSGTKMAVASIDEVLEYTKGQKLIEILKTAKEKHEAYGNRIHEYLLNIGSNDKDPSVMAKGMSWLKINMKMTMDEADSTVAELITDGCNMGIESLKNYMHEYPDAEKEAKSIANEIIKTENDMINSLKEFL
ncbi:MAG: hypothetical protein ACLRZ9_05205 [Eubacterium sp.]